MTRDELIEWLQQLPASAATASVRIGLTDPDQWDDFDVVHVDYTDGVVRIVGDADLAVSE